MNAIESCAAGRVDGTFRGDDLPNADDCLDPAVLEEYEPSLGPLGASPMPPIPGGYQVAPIGDGSAGYLVQGATDDEPPVWFAELHQPDGSVVKVCGPNPFTTMATDGSGQDAPGCDDGSW